MKSILTLKDGWFLSLQLVTILCQLVGMVFTRVANPVNHQCHAVRSTDQAVKDFHLSYSSVLVEITGAVIIATRTRSQ